MIKKIRNTHTNKMLVNLGDGFVINYGESIEIDTDGVANTVKSKIKSFENLGLIKVIDIIPSLTAEELGVSEPKVETKPEPISKTRKKSTKKED